MTTVSQMVLSLRDLKVYIFIDDYEPQYTSDGAFKLHFSRSERKSIFTEGCIKINQYFLGALQFIEQINGLKSKRITTDAPRNSNTVKYLGPLSSVEED